MMGKRKKLISQQKKLKKDTNNLQQNKQQNEQQNNNFLSDNPFLGQLLELDADDIEYFIKNEVIGEKIPNKDEIFKYAHDVNCDMDYLLNLSIQMSDIESVEISLKYGASFEKLKTVDDGAGYLISCIYNDDIPLLELLIKNGFNVNAQTEVGSILSASLNFKKWKSSEILLNAGALIYNKINEKHIDMKNNLIFNRILEKYNSGKCSYLENYSDSDSEYDSDSDDDKINKFLKKITKTLIEYSGIEIILNMHNNDPSIEMRKIFKMLVDRTEFLRNQDINNMIKCIKINVVDLVDIILDKFPDELNTIHNKTTILGTLIDSENSSNKHYITKYFQLETTKLNIDIHEPYIHKLIKKYDIDNIKIIINRDKTQLLILNSRKRNPIETLLIHFDEKYQDNIKDIIDYFISLEPDIINYKLFELAFQYCNKNVFEYLFKYIKNIFLPKLYIIACSLDRIDELEKIFLKNDIDPETINKNFDTELLDNEININIVPTCLTIAIFYDRINTIKYLMNKKSFQVYDNKKILNYCVNVARCNKNIMKYFSTKEHIETLIFDKLDILSNNLDRFFKNIFYDYGDNRETIIREFGRILYFFKEIISIPDSKIRNKQLYDIIKKYLHMNIIYNNTVSYAISFIILSKNKEKIEEYIDHIGMLINHHMILELTNDEENMIITLKKILKQYTYEINNAMTLLKYSLEKIYDLKNYDIIYRDNIEYAEKVLINLRYPIIQQYYIKMINNIIGDNCIITETDKNITINDNTNNIKTTIHKYKNLKQPENWFLCYSYNIGSKQDDNHMFPFVLDKKLSKVSCYQKITKDVINNIGSTKIIYFFGKLESQGKSTYGVFEYFIDGYHSLFHRLFRPFEQLSDKLKLNMAKYMNIFINNDKN